MLQYFYLTFGLIVFYQTENQSNINRRGVIPEFRLHQQNAPATIQRSLNGKQQKAVKATDPQQFAEEEGEGWYYDEEAKLLWVKGRKAGDETIRFTFN